MRGAVHLPSRWHQDHRITPADAGSRLLGVFGAAFQTDHPRGCGEQYVRINCADGEDGSPPRMRGADDAKPNPRAWQRITPADAGSSASLISATAASQDHPRGCGEQSEVFGDVCKSGGSPPRMRGAVRLLSAVASGIRITPADAGSSDVLAFHHHHCEDHPRGCGEQTKKS